MSLGTRTNATLCYALLLAAAVVACNAEPDETKPPCLENPPINNAPPPTHFYTHITDASGRSILHSKLPSTLIDNKLVDICKQGQVPFLDHCYDAVHLNDRVAGFRLESPTRTFVVAETANTALLSALEQIGSFYQAEFAITRYAHRLTFKCQAATDVCMPPSLLKYGLSVMRVHGNNYIDNLKLDTSFAWGDAYQHKWPVRGTLTINGKVHLLPLTRARVKRAYGDRMMGNSVRHGHVTTRYIFAATYPESEQVLTGVNYRVNNYARAAALRSQ